ncbi:MAG: nucleotidyltransferase domain-containing protein [Candidatus Nanoarchaeia archaeon]
MDKNKEITQPTFSLPQQLREEILSTINPSLDEKIKTQAVVDEFLKHLRAQGEKSPYSITFELGGSYAKDTYLKGDFDVDIFCIFKEKIEDSLMCNFIREILESIKVSFSIEQGSRTYYSGRYESSSKQSIQFECVPTQWYENPYDAVNSTDLSIHHVKFVQQEIEKNPQLCSEIRLAKQWFKANELYGAESYINGFSGHGIECLIIQLQSFERLINTLSNINKGEVFTFHSSKDEYLKMLSKDKHSPILMQDPIIKHRNALSALNSELFYKAKLEAIKASINPLCISQFQIPLYPNKRILYKSIFNNSKQSYVGVKIDVLENLKSKDIIGSKCKKIVQKLSQHLKSEGFQVNFIEFKYVDSLQIAYGKIVLESNTISSVYYHKGPTLDINHSSIKEFLKKYSQEQLFVYNNSMYVSKERRFSDVEDFINVYSSTQKIINLINMRNIEELVEVEMFI